MTPKTAHQLARELLAGPDIPIFHFDPSFADACDEENDYTLGEVKVELVDPADGVDAEEVARRKEEGFCLCPFLTIVGDQPEEYDRQGNSDLGHLFQDETSKERNPAPEANGDVVSFPS